MNTATNNTNTTNNRLRYVKGQMLLDDADYGMNEIGIPAEQAWKLYGSYVQRRLVKSGMVPAAAFKHLKDRSPQALKALSDEMNKRPFVFVC